MLNAVITSSSCYFRLFFPVSIRTEGTNPTRNMEYNGPKQTDTCLRFMVYTPVHGMLYHTCLWL